MNGTRLTHKALFEKYTDDTVLNKARKYAHWTLPQLMADVSLLGPGNTVVLERDYQEIGALLVNNLASKLAGLLFPSSRPFFNIDLSKSIKDEAKRKGTKPEDLASGVAQLEMAACQRVFLNGSYEQLVLAMKHLIVTGNVLLYRNTKTGKTTTYGITSHAVRRDGEGNVMDCILRQYSDFRSLAPEVQQVLALKNPRYQIDTDETQTIELYTRIRRDQNAHGDAVYHVSQQAEGMDVGTPGVYPEHLCPWQAVPWSLVAGENYGRGLVEDYAGGFAKLSDQSLAATLYGIEVAKLVNLVAPGQGADVDELNNAGVGEYVQGTEESVHVHEGGDANKLEQFETIIQNTFGRLARAFMYKANTRDAERVTAYELKQDALEAENTLGGTYSSLSATMQVPMAHVLLTEADPGMLEGIITKTIKLGIIAGLNALGRQANIQNLAAAAQDAAAIIPVFAQLSQRVDKDKLLDLILAGQSVDPTSVYKDKDKLAAEQAAQQQQDAGQAQIQQSTTLADQAQQLQGIQ